MTSRHVTSARPCLGSGWLPLVEAYCICGWIGPVRDVTLYEGRRSQLQQTLDRDMTDHLNDTLDDEVLPVTW